MKYILLKEVTFNFDSGAGVVETTLDYKRQMMLALKVSDEGSDLEDMLKAQRCWRALEKRVTGEYLELEDADAEYLAACVRKAKFRFKCDEAIEYMQATLHPIGEKPLANQAAGV